MWDDVGILRDAATACGAALAALDDLDAALDATGVADGDRAYNLTWHDWLNLKNLVLVSRVHRAPRRWRARTRAARTSARIFPTTSDLATSRYTVARLARGRRSRSRPSRCISRASSPGETLLREAAE